MTWIWAMVCKYIASSEHENPRLPLLLPVKSDMDAVTLTDESFGQLSWCPSEASGNWLAENAIAWHMLDMPEVGSASSAVTAKASPRIPSCVLGIPVPGIWPWCWPMHILSGIVLGGDWSSGIYKQVADVYVILTHTLNWPSQSNCDDTLTVSISVSQTSNKTAVYSVGLFLTPSSSRVVPRLHHKGPCQVVCLGYILNYKV